MALYAQSSGTQSTNSASFVPIHGLTLTIPEGVGTSALIILNLPMPFAEGSNNPGGTFGITVNGALSPVVAGFTYNEQVPPSPGRVPTTLVVSVPLAEAAQTIVGVWSGVRHSDYRHAGDAQRNPGLTRASAAGQFSANSPSRRDADLGQSRRTLALVDGHMASMPVRQRRVARGERDIQHATDDDRMRMPLDGCVDFTIDPGQGAYQSRPEMIFQGFPLQRAITNTPIIW